MPDSRVTDEIVEQARAWERRNGDERTATHLPEWWREVLEAVWPEPTFTPDEIKALLWVSGVGWAAADDGFPFPRDGNRQIIESAKAKLEACVLKSFDEAGDEPRYVCVACRREGSLEDFQDDCKPGWTHDRLLPIETTALDALRDDYGDQQLLKLAEVGAALCCYAPGAGSPELWPESRCDCKYLGPAGGSFSTISEQTGCAEVRGAYRAVKARFGR